MMLNDFRLLIYASSEQPAWDIPLHGGQEYTGMDQNDGGGLTLIIDMGDWSQLSSAQVDYLLRERLSYTVVPGWASPQVLRRAPNGEVIG